jgi:hypothetical protein
LRGCFECAAPESSVKPSDAIGRPLTAREQRFAHTCHWPGCDKRVPPAMWGCKAHWFSLPKRLRDRIWRAYRPGQEITKTPSAEYIEAAQEVQRWIKEFKAGSNHKHKAK